MRSKSGSRRRGWQFFLGLSVLGALIVASASNADASVRADDTAARAGTVIVR